MDFFEQQDIAKRKTGRLVFLFALAVVLMIAVLYLVVIFAFGATQTSASDRLQQVSYWRPEILLLVVLVTGTIVGLGSLYKTAQLRTGGESVATMLGGRRVNPNTTDLAERQLLNVVEEMALAAGMVVPAVYVLDRETSINAFAAGFTADDAVIGVNRGTLEYLTRDELQGVIAHEFSHILNGDMRLNIRLIGILHGILVLAIIGYYLLYSAGGARRSRDSKGAAPLLILGLAAMVIGYIGLFFGRLIKASVSRQREYLADAAAVQFTRHPDGIAGALKKIGGLSEGSRVATPEAETASHMFFGSALQRMSFNPLATHPPLVERIRRLDPQFDGKFAAVRPVRTEPARRQRPADKQAKTGWRGPLSLDERLGTDPLMLLANIGTLGERQLQHSAQLLEQMPQPLIEAVHDAFSARAVVFALLLDEQTEAARRQLLLVEQREGKPTAEETRRLVSLVREQGPEGRLPLIELVYNGLQGLSVEQYRRFRETVTVLVAADKRVSLFEFVLQRVLLDHLDRHFGLVGRPRTKFNDLAAMRPQTAALLSGVVYAGTTDPAAAQRAFQAAVSELEMRGRPPELLPIDAVGVQLLSDALADFVLASPSLKKQLLGAAMVAMASDGHLTVMEAELVRAIATALDCPLPPIFGQSTAPVT